jgi:hypothetical protein
MVSPVACRAAPAQAATERAGTTPRHDAPTGRTGHGLQDRCGLPARKPFNASSHGRSGVRPASIHEAFDSTE